MVKTLSSQSQGIGSIPGQGTKIPYVSRHGQKLKTHTQYIYRVCQTVISAMEKNETGTEETESSDNDPQL